MKEFKLLYIHFSNILGKMGIKTICLKICIAFLWINYIIVVFIINFSILKLKKNQILKKSVSDISLPTYDLVTLVDSLS